MLSADMSLIKSLAITLTVSVLFGCELLPTQSDTAMSRPLPVTELHSLSDWLDISSQVGKLSAEQSEAALRKLGKPTGGHALFHYAALNQQLSHHEGWIQARDAFRKLANDNSLESNLRELARIMESHNQALINWHARHTHLQKELAASVLDRELLERKITALTELEATISQRKQQSLTPEPPQQISE